MRYSDDYLAHYGVIGMKWGVRRYEPYSSKPRKSGKGGKEIGEAKKKKRDSAKRVLKTTAKVAAVGAAAYFGPKLAFKAAVQYYIHKPKVDAVFGAAKKSISKVPVKDLSISSYTKKVAAISGALGTTTVAAKRINEAKSTFKRKNNRQTDSVTKKAANQMLDKYKSMKVSEIDPNELQRSVQFLNNLNRIEELSKKKG